jgi:quercetin dioxygenase-like cupin family protein
VTKGKALVMTERETLEASAGDILYFSSDEVHGFRNEADSTFEFYCIIGCVGNGENCIGLGSRQ